MSEGKKLRLYPPVVDVPHDFSVYKEVTVPDQSMSLKEILRRFVRRESLPVEKQGIYVEGFGDLEKFESLDFTEQEERIDEARKRTDEIKKSRAKADAKAKAEAKAKAGAAARETDPPAAGSGSDPGDSASSAE